MTFSRGVGQDASIEGMGKTLDGLIGHLVDQIALTSDNGKLSEVFFVLDRYSGHRKFPPRLSAFLHLRSCLLSLLDHKRISHCNTRNHSSSYASRITFAT